MTLTLETYRGNSTNPERMAVHTHRMSTLRRCPWPRRNSRWWRWFLSGVANPVRLAVRRTKAKAMSMRGTPRMKKGMNSGAKKK